MGHKKINLEYLKKGVSFHAFNDVSGCSFYNHNSGETVSIQVGADELFEYYRSLNSQVLPEKEIYAFLQRLIDSEFICAPVEWVN
ncbi:MAG: hypothetical protein ACJA13_000551 [Paraglaciecola sp.]|jgi:hypothetical protein